MAGASGQDQLDELDGIDDGEEIVLDGGGGEEGDPPKKKQPEAGDDLEVVIDTGEGAGEGEAEGAGEGEGEGQGDAEAEGDDGSQAAATDDEDASYSAKVRKRIARERRLAEEAQAERDQERIERGNVEKQLRATVKFSTELAITNLDFQIKEAQGELKKAVEAGETDKQVEAQSKLGELQAKKREAENAKARLEQEEQQAKQQRPGADGKQPAPKNPLTERWAARNKWFGDKRFAAQVGAVRAIDKQMFAEGYRPDSEAYFIELDKRIHRELPQLRARIRQAGYGPKADQGQGPRKPQGGALPVRTQTQRPGAVSKTRVVLNKVDLENMERFGMDPNSREHQVEYARQKTQGGK